MMPQSSDRNAFIVALAITLGLGWGLVYFVQELWPLLPGWLALILFIILAVLVIGYPIYALARWSDRYLQRRKPPQPPADRPDNDRQ